MGENSKQLNVDVGSNVVPKSISNILAEVSSRIHDNSKKSSRLDFYVQLLEEEMTKIDAFKRELPLCMHLLQDSIEILKNEKLRLKEKWPMMEEFIPLKKSDPEGGGRAKPSYDFIEKKNWMSAFQLWSTPVQYESSFDNKNQDAFLSLKSFNGFDWKNRGGAFVPFKKPSSPGDVTIKEEKRAVPFEGLTFSIPVSEVEESTDDDSSVKGDSGFIRPKLQQPHQQEQQRKQRRCWGPTLHRLFVDALNELGGAQVATPKQIRERMKVDGLTNDEVKSHLQKYRIHIRRVPPSERERERAAILPGFPWYRQAYYHRGESSTQSVMVRQDYQRGESSNQVTMVGQSDSPKDHLQQVVGSVNGGGSGTGGESMEDDEDDKAEIRSWKSRFQKPN